MLPVASHKALSNAFYNIYINDLNRGLTSDISKFVDDTKTGRLIRSDNDAAVMQEEINGLCEWSKKWMMHFHIANCRVKSVGKNNALNNYTLNYTALSH